MLAILLKCFALCCVVIVCDSVITVLYVVFQCCESFVQVSLRWFPYFVSML
jgi:hypothetical protein